MTLRSHTKVTFACRLSYSFGADNASDYVYFENMYLNGATLFPFKYLPSKLMSSTMRGQPHGCHMYIIQYLYQYEGGRIEML